MEQTFKLSLPNLKQFKAVAERMHVEYEITNVVGNEVSIKTKSENPASLFHLGVGVGIEISRKIHDDIYKQHDNAFKGDQGAMMGKSY